MRRPAPGARSSASGAVSARRAPHRGPTAAKPRRVQPLLRPARALRPAETDDTGRRHRCSAAPPPRGVEAEHGATSPGKVARRTATAARRASRRHARAPALLAGRQRDGLPVRDLLVRSLRPPSAAPSARTGAAGSRSRRLRRPSRPGCPCVSLAAAAERERDPEPQSPQVARPELHRDSLRPICTDRPPPPPVPSNSVHARARLAGGRPGHGAPAAGSAKVAPAVSGRSMKRRGGMRRMSPHPLRRPSAPRPCARPSRAPPGRIVLEPVLDDRARVDARHLGDEACPEKSTWALSSARVVQRWFAAPRTAGRSRRRPGRPRFHLDRERIGQQPAQLAAVRRAAGRRSDRR